MSIEDHVDSLVDNIFGVVAQELEDVLHLSLVWETPESDTIFPGSSSDKLLGYHSDRGQARGQTRDERRLGWSWGTGDTVH